MNKQEKKVPPYLKCKIDPVIELVMQEQTKKQKDKVKKAKPRKKEERTEEHTPFYFLKHED